MMNLLTLLIGISGIILLARYNKSNALFWKLFIALMIGFVSGSIVAHVTKSNKNGSVTAQLSQMQVSAPSMTANFSDFKWSAETTVIITDLASPRIVVSDADPVHDPLTGIYESDVGNLFTPYNTS